ncbi:MAG: hypothetical protein ACM3XZ_05360 [Betaproteobacteria bacterium]
MKARAYAVAVWVALAACLALPEAAGSQAGPSLSGYLAPALTLQSTTAGEQYTLQNHLRLKVDWQAGEEVSARGEFDIRTEDRHGAGETQVTADAGVDRLYLRLVSGATQLTLGRQRISWGDGTAFAPADFFNPPDPSDPSAPRPGADGVLVRHAIGTLGYVAAAAAVVNPAVSSAERQPGVTGSFRFGTHVGHTDLDAGWGYDGVARRAVTFLEARGDLGVGWHASLAHSRHKDASSGWSGAAGVDYSLLGGQLIGSVEYAAGPAPGDARERPRWAVSATYLPTEITSYQLNLLLDTDPASRPQAVASLTQVLADQLDLSLRVAAPLGVPKTSNDTFRGAAEVRLRYSF